MESMDESPDFVVFSTAPSKEMVEPAPRFNLRKLRFTASSPEPVLGQKRVYDASPEGEGDSRSQEGIQSIEKQLKKDEEEYTDLLRSAIRDFFVTQNLPWLKKYYHSAVARLQQVKDSQNKAIICKELEDSLRYWAIWHRDQFLQNLRLETVEDCAKFLDAYALLLANWGARAAKLRTYFAWVDLEYKKPGLRRQGIVDLARHLLDTHFVRDQTLWDAAIKAVDTITPVDQPLQPEMLDRIVLLESIYSSGVSSSLSNDADPIILYDHEFESDMIHDPRATPFSAFRVLNKTIRHSMEQVVPWPSENILDDWASRCNTWTARVTALFNYLLDVDQYRSKYPGNNYLRPEWHTSRKYIDHGLPILMSQVAAYALRPTASCPIFIEFLRASSAFRPTRKLVLKHLTHIMKTASQQLLAVSGSGSMIDRVILLRQVRDRLLAICKRSSDKEDQALNRLTEAMQKTVKRNAGSLFIQLRRGQDGPEAAILNELRKLNLDITPEEADFDEIHSRSLAVDVAIDLLPPRLGGSSTNPATELTVLKEITNEFKTSAEAFSWMPTVMAAEAARLENSSPALLHYVAWLANHDPLLTTTPPAVLAPYLTPLSPDERVYWHPSWSVISLTVGGSEFSCSVVQLELLKQLIEATEPIPEQSLISQSARDSKDALQARRVALLDLVSQSNGFVRLSKEGLYAIDASVLPSGPLAVARFCRDDQ